MCSVGSRCPGKEIGSKHHFKWIILHYTGATSVKIYGVHINFMPNQTAQIVGALYGKQSYSLLYKCILKGPPIFSVDKYCSIVDSITYANRTR